MINSRKEDRYATKKAQSHLVIREQVKEPIQLVEGTVANVTEKQLIGSPGDSHSNWATYAHIVLSEDHRKWECWKEGSLFASTWAVEWGVNDFPQWLILKNLASRLEMDGAGEFGWTWLNRQYAQASMLPTDGYLAFTHW